MKTKSWWMDCLWLSLGIAILFGFMLGCRALSVPDEARYTEIPREMLLFHDFITPHLDGIKYFEKPPLLYWIQSGAIALWGINEWALRLPTALIALLGCLFTYLAGRSLFDRVTGLISAVILATSPLYFAMAHSITLDMTVSVWLSLTLFAFIVAVDLPVDSVLRRNVCWVMYIAAALAVMTKGLIGIVLPGMVIFSWLLIFNRWRELKRINLVSGLLIFLLISVPWHILVQIKNPEFFHFYFVDQHFTRYFTKAMGRYKPFWWFVPILFGGLFPWIMFLPQAIRNVTLNAWLQRKQPMLQRKIFLLLWALEIFLFFSWSDSKLIPYIVPVFPPLAVLIGGYMGVVILEGLAVIPAKAGIQLEIDSSLRWNDNADSSLRWNDNSISFILISIIAVLFALAAGSIGFWHHGFSIGAIHHLYVVAMILIVMAVGVWCFSKLKQKIYWLLVLQILFLWSLVATIPYFDQRPIKPLALLINQYAKPNDVVASYGLYYQDLPVYTQRLVLIVDWKNELEFGSQHQANANHYLIDQQQFWKIWQSPQHVFAVMDKDDYQHLQSKYKLYLVAQHAQDYLVSNQSEK